MASQELKTLPFNNNERVSFNYYENGVSKNWNGSLKEAIETGHITEECMINEGEYLVFYFNRVAIARIKTKSYLKTYCMFFDSVDSSKAFGHMDRETRCFKNTTELLVSKDYITQNKIAVVR